MFQAFHRRRCILQKPSTNRRHTAPLRLVIYHWRRLFRVPASIHSIALGFSAGVFISFTPLIGFHLLLAATMAFLLRANIVSSAVGTIIGNPLTFPIIWLSSHRVGMALLDQPSEPALASNFNDYTLISASMIQSFTAIFWPMMAGGIPLGLMAAIISYAVVYCSITTFRNRRGRMRVLRG